MSINLNLRWSNMTIWMTTVVITSMNNQSWDVYSNTLLSCACGFMAQLQAQAAKIDETFVVETEVNNCRMSTSAGGFGEGHCFGFLILTNKEKMPGETTMYIKGIRAFIQACSPAWTPASWSRPPCARLSWNLPGWRTPGRSEWQINLWAHWKLKNEY